MKIVLIGYMGSGKSTIGKLLSKKLEIKFIDLDNYIETKLKMPISKIFEMKGELFFRKKENELLNELMQEKIDFVLSTGGGTPCYGNNLDLIKANTTHNFYLKMSISGLVERLMPEKEHRPLIKNTNDDDLPEFIGKHLFERNNYYLKANHIMVCDGKSIQEIVKEIMSRLQ